MKITPEQYALLKTMAEDVVASNSYHPAYKQYIKGAPTDKGVFSVKGTVAAVLVGMTRAVEKGIDPVCDIIITPFYGEEPPKPKKEQETDVFTAEALAKIPPGSPDHTMLAAPKGGDIVLVTGMKDPAHNGLKVIKDTLPRKEGEYWIDDKGRHWKIIAGKKIQQKKPKVDPTGQSGV